MVKRLLLVLGMVFMVTGSIFAADEYKENFDKPEAEYSWRSINGKWTFAEGKYIQDINDGNYQKAISSFQITDGTIEVKAIATKGNKPTRGGCFGIMKYIDNKNWYAVRYGAYGGVDIRVSEDGKARSINTGYLFKPMINQAYTIKIIIKGEKLLILLDNKVIAAVEGIPFSGKEGYAGLFALSSCSFDDFSVTKIKETEKQE